jgi:FMN phosphatase YigB (HAD superfamily)
MALVLKEGVVLKAVLIDIGGPILDEDVEYAAWDRFLLSLLRQSGLDVSEEELSRAVLSATQRCDSNPRATALWQFVRPDLELFRRLRDAFRDFQDQWTEDHRAKRLQAGAREAISALADRYVLALAGNQPAHVAAFLAEEGILDHFRWRWVSEEMRVQKPDPLFFRMILDGLSVRPEEAVMVGDRLDFDIFPAKLLGLRTVRALVGPYLKQVPPTPLHSPGYTIPEIHYLPQALARLP